MPRVSQHSLEESRIKELVYQLWDAFVLLEDRNEVKKFLSKFFTPVEIEMLAKRLELLKLADSELEPKELARLTGLSRMTVYDWLEKHDSFEEDYHIVVDRIKKINKERLAKRARKLDNANLPSNSRTPHLGEDLLKLGGVVYHGYKKRKKRRSVTED